MEAERRTYLRGLVRDFVEENERDLEHLSALFFERLFVFFPRLKKILPDDDVLLFRKFHNMFLVFRDAEHFEKISRALLSMAYRHERYGMTLEHFEPTRQAFLEALSGVWKEKFVGELKEAWELSLDELLAVFRRGYEEREEYETLGKVKKYHYPRKFNANLLSEIGGVEKIDEVHELFYDDLFDDPWLGTFFWGKDKEMLIRKQTQFMVAAFGGENLYRGATPALAHIHMYITEEMLRYREGLLRRAILAKGVNQKSCEQWLEVDRSFWNAMVKRTPSDCVMRVKFQAPVIVKKPESVDFQ